MDPLAQINTRSTPQTEQAKASQVPNSAGGYGFEVNALTRAQRFLILGTDGGSYYASEPKLTKENAQVIIDLAADTTTGLALVTMIRNVSLEGRAARQNPAIFGLAVCAASPVVEVRRAAFAALSYVCRTGTHLFLFAGYVEQFRGWGRGLQKAVADWYTEPDVEKVAFQAVKYRSRENWSHRDLLRLCHPKTDESDRKALFEWITHGVLTPSNNPSILDAFVEAQNPTHIPEKQLAHHWARLVTDYRLPWEALPDAALTHNEVWEALLPHMGITALMRNLGRLTKLGVFGLGATANKLAIDQLTDADVIRKGRLHPLNILTALMTYRQGHGMRGGMEWTPVPQLIDALDEAFYLGFGALEPANKRTLIGLDVSGSMAAQMSSSPLTCRQAAAAMAMTVARTEPDYLVMGFSDQFVHLPITARQRLDAAVDMTNNLPFSRTDCSLPMKWAMANKVAVDSFLVYTDSETYAGVPHPHQALEQYRQATGIPARLVVVGMVSNGFTIADPDDAGMMDVVGFDTATPDLIRGFSAGEF